MKSPLRRVCTISEMRKLEAMAIKAGMDKRQLMENAGAAVFREISAAADSLAGKSVLVLVGPGDNGGDGLVIARHLALAGASVTVVLSRPRDSDPLRDSAAKAGARIAGFADGIARGCAASSDIVVDCLLGIGSSPPLRGEIERILRDIEGVNGPLMVACDVASGIDADTGKADKKAFSAEITVATGPTKVGSILQPALAKSGRPIETDIGLPKKYLSELPGRILLAEEDAAAIPVRPADGHKGTFGKVLVVAGCRAYRGAATLACLGAARAGAGMVSLASIEPAIAATAARISSVTYQNLVELDGYIAASNVEAVAESIAAADAAVIGPGLGRNRETDEFVRSLLGAIAPDKRLVVDADALNACAPADGPLAACKASLVLTPHPGEMGRLLGLSTADVQENRLASALEASRILGHVVVLKGAGSIVAESDGSYAVSPLAVPSLSHAGSGDVLAGAIGSLLAQGLDPAPAARLGVTIHSLAGENVGQKFGPAGAIADDLPEAIPGVIESLRALDDS